MLTDVSEEFIALMMEAVSTSETSVNVFHTTRRNIPEESHLQFNVCLLQCAISVMYMVHAVY
jgi:cell division protein FtsL